MTTKTTKFAKQAQTAIMLNAQRRISKSTLEATVLIEGIDTQVIKCKARETFTKGRVTVEAGREFFLVRSSKFAGRYYVVCWSNEQSAWQCSCHCYCSKSEHCQIVNQWVVDHVVSPKREQDQMLAKVRQAVERLSEEAVVVNSVPAPRTKEEWKAALARQKEADRQYKRTYLEQARSLREIA